MTQRHIKNMYGYYTERDLALVMDKVLSFIDDKPCTRRELMIKFHEVHDHDMDMVIATLEAGRILESRYHVIKRKTKG